MTLERRAFLATALAVVLIGGCSQPDRPGPAETQAAANPAIALDSQLTDHLAAAAVWGDLVTTLARSDTPIAVLAAAAAYMEEEISQALDLAKDPGTEALGGDAGQIDSAGQRRVEKLQEARTHAIEVGRVLAATPPDRAALAHASQETSVAVQAAGEAHDSIIPSLRDDQHLFRMFALTWPHHELALRYALLDSDLTRMDAARGSTWTQVWKIQLDRLENDLVDSRSAFRAFADKLDPLVNTYGREQRDDRFNAWTDEIRRQHDAIQRLIGDIRAELGQAAPNLMAATASLESIRTDLEAARENHRKIAGEIGEPYPDYSAALGQAPSR